MVGGGCDVSASKIQFCLDAPPPLAGLKFEKIIPSK